METMMPTGRPNNPELLSKDPAQIRRRLRRKHRAHTQDLELYQDVVYGKRMEDWDLEELARGRPRDKNGRFSGRVPTWLSPALQQEAKRRLLEETYGLLAGHVTQAVKTMGQLLVSDEVDDNGKPIVDSRTKFAAAAFIIEHMIGKPKALVEVKAEISEAKQAIAAAIVLDDGQPQDIIEGDWEDAEDDDTDDE
jgi:hypothetical protein